MRVNKNHRVVQKRILSFMMALAVAFAMAFVAMPQKVLAEDKPIYVYSDGTVTLTEDTSKTPVADLYGTGDYTASDASKVTFSNNTIELNGINIVSFLIHVKGITIKIIGTGNEIGDLILSKVEDKKVTIQMTKNSSVIIKEAMIDGIEPSKPSAWGDSVTILDGTMDANGNITAKADAPEPSGTSGQSGNSGEQSGNNGQDTNSNAQKAEDVKVGASVQEKDKTADESATYKVTSTDEGNRTVTYEKPAENASGTENIAAKVTLADNKEYTVTEIAPSAFASFGGKDNISKIVIADTVTNIGTGACKGMSNLTEVTIGNGVTKIGDSAFDQCKALTKADITDNVEEIGASAFAETKLKSVVIGKKVKKIGAKAYYDCSSLKNIKVKSTKLTKKSRVGKNAFGKINKKAKVRMKMTKKEAAKVKVKTINVFKTKKIGYVKTWTVS